MCFSGEGDIVEFEPDLDFNEDPADLFGRVFLGTKGGDNCRGGERGERETEWFRAGRVHGRHLVFFDNNPITS